MKQDLGYLPLFSAKMAFALLGACETGQLSADAEEYAIDALKHYNSDWKWFPEPLPGLGHLDDFIYLLSAMWVCQEGQFPRLTAAELELLPKRLNSFFRRRSKALLEVPSEAIESEEESTPAAEEKTQEKAKQEKSKDNKRSARMKNKNNSAQPPSPKRPSDLSKSEKASISFQ